MSAKYKKCTARNSQAVHFTNMTDRDLCVGDEIQIGCLTARVKQDVVCQGKNGAAEFKSRQEFIDITLEEPITQDYGFGETMVAPDGQEYIVVGVHNQFGAYGGVAAPAGTKCVRVIDPCCCDNTEDLSDACLCKTTEFSGAATNVNSIQVGTDDPVTGPWTQANYEDAVTGIGAALEAAGYAPVDGCTPKVLFQSDKLIIEGYAVGVDELTVDYS